LDDNLYVYENPQVSRGLTTEGIAWAFSDGDTAAMWLPLTWISLMSDCQIYGLNAGGYHLTNVLLHAATTVFLFLVLSWMTGCNWRSALVAALFAIHPLRVESVAWVTERKDVLSGVFFVLTLGAYVGYVRHRFSLVRYLAVIVLFALGLMSKPMLVTLPFVLCLLDYWPLDRFTPCPSSGPMPTPGNERAILNRAKRMEVALGRCSLPVRLVLEKVPHLLLVVAFCMITAFCHGNYLVTSACLPLGWRMGNAAVSYVAYLGQCVCPAGLAVLYPHPGDHLPIGSVLFAVVVLALISTAALVCRRRCPYWLVGWLWYLVMLAPVIGLMQAGLQARADRFTYLPQIGLCIALVWGVADLCWSWLPRRGLCGVASALVLTALMGCAWRQTTFWRDGETLWTHCLACTSRNFAAHVNMAFALQKRGKIDAAILEYQKALYLRPQRIGFDDPATYNNLGLALALRGRSEEAIAQYQKALEIRPDCAYVHCNLGRTLQARGRIEEAITHYRKAIEVQPDCAEAYSGLGLALQVQGRIEEALTQHRKAVKVKPDYGEGHYHLGNALARRGRLDEAIRQFRQTLELHPDDAKAHNDLGAALQLQGQLDQAIAHFQRAVEIEPGNLNGRNNLGKALASRKQFDAAILQFRRVLDIKADDADAQNNLAWLRATAPKASLRNGAAAVEHAQRANGLCGGRRPDVLLTLAAAYAEAGRFAEALPAACKALELARQQNNQALADALRVQIALYKAGKPFRQMLAAPTPRPPKP
jgi:tetratricopeptide (TPR) repeat protein